ncbi:hypothetical protein KOR34_36270 [Posidoniimonas corsicana]|uniref:PEP-CTERM protein-sorting domain-containing protein n=1 Tax=Posidoniimonas corsicana TaxID=1938618 RepID=A0A5C5V752_9BACT|nr:hypothetical protein [Posidoniimonas corsicana]TWT33793.1 hypothetical protein KOR34_36270 [Posidoniimonas corsicana]
MKVISTLCVTLLASSICLQSEGAIELNNYTLNFTAAAVADGVAPGDLASLGISNLTNVDEWGFEARSFIGFTDGGVGGAGVISAGDTFKDYIAVQVTGFEPAGGGNITPLRYGGGVAGKTHELTALVEISGVQLTNNTYAITGLSRFDIYFDAGDSTDPSLGPTGGVDYAYTPADFSNLNTFDDGTLVESAGLVAGGGNNSGPVLPNGTISLVLTLIDQIVGDTFEIDFLDQNGSPLAIGGLHLGLADANNLLDNTTLVSAIATKFGFNPGVANSPPPGLYVGGDFDFGFASSSEGSLNKVLIPEPTTFLVWSVLAMTALSARRHRV